MDTKKMAMMKELLETAERSVRSARTLLNEFLGEAGNSAVKANSSGKNFSVTETDTEKIVEGVFDGEKMLGPDGRAYPVPHNYASKSKLIPGDLLKLTIAQDGRFIYKNIGPIDRRSAIGVLTYEDDAYKVIAEGKAYKVLTASVTFFKAEPGDQLSIVVPAHHDSSWAAVEALITQPTEQVQAQAQAQQIIAKEKPTATEGEAPVQPVIETKDEAKPAKEIKSAAKKPAVKKAAPTKDSKAEEEKTDGDYVAEEK